MLWRHGDGIVWITGCVEPRRDARFNHHPLHLCDADCGNSADLDPACAVSLCGNERLDVTTTHKRDAGDDSEKSDA